MNIRTARDETSFLFPTNISYVGATDATGTAQQADATPISLGQRIARAVAWIAEMPRRHKVLAELEMMNDRELADIGLERGELSKVFAPEFAATRAR